jgi:uncharacterized BrkB/YihY/UPF0761 family membrane protein
MARLTAATPPTPTIEKPPRWLYVTLAIVSIVVVPAVILFLLVGIGFAVVGALRSAFARQPRSYELGQQSVAIGASMLVGPFVWLVVFCLYITLPGFLN